MRSFCYRDDSMYRGALLSYTPDDIRQNEHRASICSDDIRQNEHRASISSDDIRQNNGKHNIKTHNAL